jgi:hypothetical protein
MKFTIKVTDASEETVQCMFHTKCGEEEIVVIPIEFPGDEERTKLIKAFETICLNNIDEGHYSIGMLMEDIVEKAFMAGALAARSRKRNWSHKVLRNCIEKELKKKRKKKK